jgi:toxin ParE1/3/4
VQCCRQEAGAAVADKLVQAIAKALQDLERSASIGSPALGRHPGIDELRTWRLQGLPLTFWYFERADHIEVIRLAWQRQDQRDVERTPSPTRLGCHQPVVAGPPQNGGASPDPIGILCAAAQAVWQRTDYVAARRAHWQSSFRLEESLPCCAA